MFTPSSKTGKNISALNFKYDKGGIWVWIILSVFAILAFPSKNIVAETLEEKKQSIQSQIDALEKEAEQINSDVQKTQKEAETLKNEISIFNSEIRKREIEIKKLALAIKQAELDIQDKNQQINNTEGKIAENRKRLAATLLRLNDYENEGIFGILIKHKTLSTFLLAVDDLFALQKSIKVVIGDLRNEDENLKNQKDDLEDFQQGQQNLKSLQEVEKKFMDQKKKERDALLKVTKGKEAVYQQMLSAKKKDIAALRTQLFYLGKTGVSAEDALKFASLAAERTGIRPAFLLAILEVETGKQFEDGVISVGTNLGTGNWKTDMYDCYRKLGKTSAAESQKNAFFAITDKLGLDPDKMPVSRKPSYGCGGAMGPAQFIPTTWLLFAEGVGNLTGHKPPSPWNIEDSFTAAALFLADSGASSQTKTGELRASRIYISGRATCTSSNASGRACNYYANRVYSLSQDIDRVI